MLRLNTKIKFTNKAILKCEKHIRYNPEKDGKDGVRGACSTCLYINQVYMAHLQMIDALRNFQQMIKPYEITPKPRLKTTGTSEPLDKAFKTLLPPSGE